MTKYQKRMLFVCIAVCIALAFALSIATTTSPPVAASVPAPSESATPVAVAAPEPEQTTVAEDRNYAKELAHWKVSHRTDEMTFNPRNLIRVMSDQSAMELDAACDSGPDDAFGCDQSWKFSVGLYIRRYQGETDAYISMRGIPIISSPQSFDGSYTIDVLWELNSGKLVHKQYAAGYGSEGCAFLLDPHQFIADLRLSRFMTVRVTTYDGAESFNFNTADFPEAELQWQPNTGDLATQTVR